MIIKDEGFRVSADSELLNVKTQKTQEVVNELFSQKAFDSAKGKSKNDHDLKGWPSQADSENTINFDFENPQIKMIKPVPPRVVAHAKKEESNTTSMYYGLGDNTNPPSKYNH